MPMGILGILGIYKTRKARSRDSGALGHSASRACACAARRTVTCVIPQPGPGHPAPCGGAAPPASGPLIG